MGSFTIERINGLRIIRITMVGMYDFDDVERLAVAEADFVRRLRLEPKTYDAIIDVSACPIQPPPVAEALNGLSKRPDWQPRRYAFVHAGMSVKLQVKRVNDGKEVAYFNEQAEAVAWLTGETPEAVLDGAVT